MPAAQEAAAEREAPVVKMDDAKFNGLKKLDPTRIYCSHAGAYTGDGDWPEARGLSVSDLRWRARLDTAPWVVTAGADIGADGLIGRKVMGEGVAVFCQLDPDRFEADGGACEPWASDTDPTDVPKSYVQDVTTSPFTYNITQGGTMDGKMCATLPGVWEPYEQMAHVSQFRQVHFQDAR